MSENAIERLNYFNGQRLEAGDLRLEQEYHIQVQRWLMKTLFSPGVARGLGVKVLDGGKKVRLEPGLALDDLGRAIILVAPVELTPQARLLCIRYAERKERPQPAAGCAANVEGGATVPARWGGGPERILSQPDIFWRADPPMHDTRELIVAELLLKSDCSVEKVVAGARHRASPLPVQQVHQISFEGEKDIAKGDKKVIHFFIRGGRPNAVTLYLRATEFSQLHYSEMGTVTPNITGTGTGGKIQTEVPSGVDAHSHDVGTIAVSNDSPPHSHQILSRVFLPDITLPPPGANTKRGIFIATEGVTAIGASLAPVGLVVTGLAPADDLANKVSDFSVDGGAHSHPIAGKTGTAPQDAAPLHTHEIKVQVSSAGQTGQTTVRQGNQFLYVSELKIGIGKKGSVVDRTYDVLQYVKDNFPSGNNPTSIWSNQGSFVGKPTYPLYEAGTGPIRLDLIDGLSFDPDEYVPYEITLSVENNNETGGCIQYNLFVE
jgi:hypothetical protein